MKIFKNIKDGKLYSIVELKIGVYTALPYNHQGAIISNCNINDFVPISIK